MFFYLSKIVSPFTDPVAVVFVILVGSGLLYVSGRGRWGWRGIGIAIGFMTIVMFTPLDYWLMSPLENRFPLPTAPACLDGIVVLSWGEDAAESVRRGVPLMESAPMRYVVLAELMRRYPAAKVIFSGGTGSVRAQLMTEADIAKAIMVKLQMDSGRVLFESKSRTTWENAKFANELAQPKAGERWALLAPAVQMPRAVGAFRKIGWDVLPWPTDYTGIESTWWRQNPSRRFGIIDAGEHQWLGLLAYWVTGRSLELFPGPTTDAPHKDIC
jgi:uncharacterized SAM-binding protein YcdF (DUF218 family)